MTTKTALTTLRVGMQMRSAWGLCVVTGIENQRTVVTYRELDEHGYEGRERVQSAAWFLDRWSR